MLSIEQVIENVINESKEPLGTYDIVDKVHDITDVDYEYIWDALEDMIVFGKLEVGIDKKVSIKNEVS